MILGVAIKDCGNSGRRSWRSLMMGFSSCQGDIIEKTVLLFIQ